MQARGTSAPPGPRGLPPGLQEPGTAGSYHTASTPRCCPFPSRCPAPSAPRGAQAHTCTCRHTRAQMCCHRSCSPQQWFHNRWVAITSDMPGKGQNRACCKKIKSHVPEGIRLPLTGFFSLQLIRTPAEGPPQSLHFGTLLAEAWLSHGHFQQSTTFLSLRCVSTDRRQTDEV